MLPSQCILAFGKQPTYTMHIHRIETSGFLARQVLDACLQILGGFANCYTGTEDYGAACDTCTAQPPEPLPVVPLPPQVSFAREEK